jgi:hypothetical protein
VFTKGDNLETSNTRTGVYQGVLGIILLVPLWQIFNQQIGHLGIKISG